MKGSGSITEMSPPVQSPSFPPIYTHMQAVGMVNDHLVDCFRYREIR